MAYIILNRKLRIMIFFIFLSTPYDTFL